MTITEDYLREAFDKYNAMIFGNRLVRPRLKLSKSRKRLGRMHCDVRVVKNLRWKKEYTIFVSVFYDLSREQLDDVLIHEMIHYAISSFGMKDTSSHGEIFRRMMNDINENFGRHITVTVKMLDVKVREEMKRKNYLVLAVTMKNGAHFLSSVNPSAAYDIEDKLVRIRDVEDYDWFCSDDDFFINMPRVRSLRGHRVDRVFFRQMIEKMRLLQSPLFFP